MAKRNRNTNETKTTENPAAENPAAENPAAENSADETASKGEKKKKRTVRVCDPSNPDRWARMLISVVNEHGMPEGWIVKPSVSVGPRATKADKEAREAMLKAMSEEEVAAFLKNEREEKANRAKKRREERAKSKAEQIQQLLKDGKSLTEAVAIVEGAAA